MQEFPWIPTDQRQLEDIPDANTVPLKSISSSMLKVSGRWQVCMERWGMYTPRSHRYPLPNSLESRSKLPSK